MSADAHEPTDIKDAVRETDQGHERSEQDVRAVRFCRGMWASVARPTQDSRFRSQLVDAMQHCALNAAHTNGVHMHSVVDVPRTGIAIAIAAAIVLVEGGFTGLIAGVAERARIRTRSG